MGRDGFLGLVCMMMMGRGVGLAGLLTAKPYSVSMSSSNRSSENHRRLFDPSSSTLELGRPALIPANHKRSMMSSFPHKPDIKVVDAADAHGRFRAS
jgi:hypothetical protein